MFPDEQELASIILKAEREAPRATMRVEKKCIAPHASLQPWIIIPKKVALSMKAMAGSNPSVWPKKSPPAMENCPQLVQN